MNLKDFDPGAFEAKLKAEVESYRESFEAHIGRVVANATREAGELKALDLDFSLIGLLNAKAEVFFGAVGYAPHGYFRSGDADLSVTVNGQTLGAGPLGKIRYEKIDPTGCRVIVIVLPNPGSPVNLSRTG